MPRTSLVIAVNLDHTRTAQAMWFLHILALRHWHFSIPVGDPSATVPSHV